MLNQFTRAIAEEAKAEEPPLLRTRAKRGQYRPRSADRPVYSQIFVSTHSRLKGRTLSFFAAQQLANSQYFPIQPFAPLPPNPLDERRDEIVRRAFWEREGAGPHQLGRQLGLESHRKVGIDDGPSAWHRRSIGDLAIHSAGKSPVGSHAQSMPLHATSTSRMPTQY